MKTTLKLEIKRIFTLRNTLALLLFFIVAQYLVYLGVTGYRTFMEEKENFTDYEILRVNQHVNYEQYGFQGFRVLWVPSPLVVFCHSSLLSIESNVDIKDSVEISSVHKGRKIFTNSGMSADFRTLFFVVGSLLMIYFGLSAFVSLKSIRFHGSWPFIFKTIGSRGIILTGYFVTVILTAFLFAKLLGVAFNRDEVITFINFSIYVVLFLHFSFFLGIFMSVIMRIKKELVVIGYLAWFLIIFVLPQVYNTDLEKRAQRIKSNEAVNIKKIASGMNFERKAKTNFENLQDEKVRDVKSIMRKFADTFIREIMPLNAAIEEKLNRQVNRLIRHHETTAVLSPSFFFTFLSNEFSSMGYYGYQDFLAYILALKERFYHYYVDKRYRQVDQSVTPLVKNNENIFFSPGVLPVNFWKGMAVTFFYAILFLAGALYSLQRQLKRCRDGEPIPVDLDRMEIGKTYFYHSRHPRQKKGMFRHLKSKGAVIIDRPSPTRHDPGTSLKAWVEFETRQKGLPDTHEILDSLDVSRKQLKKKIKSLDNETFQKAYLAVKLAQESDVYVFDDFLSRGSREFEQIVKKTIDQFKSHAVIIYFSSQMFDITVKERHQPSGLGEDFRFIAIDLNDITLR
ncbi:MAG: hypothetical protein GY940_42980 [bacterium]|nr:hypothetical protein [bacterium]